METSARKNESAFSGYYVEHDHGERSEWPIHGMTIREYFAARAPVKIPAWFTPSMPAFPKVRAFPWDRFGKESNHPHKKLYMKYFNDEANEWCDLTQEDEAAGVVIPEDFKKEVGDYYEAFLAERKACDDWQNQRDVQMIAQWPWCWADMVLNAQ